MRRTSTAFVFFAFFALCQPAPASAQRSYWGVTASGAPTWSASETFKFFYDADDMDLEGTAFRVGLSRGRTLGGEWSVLFARKNLQAGGVLVREGQTYTLGSNVAISGVEFEKFAVAGTIRERVQIGVVIAGGIGRVAGTATDQSGATIDASDVLATFGTGNQFHPLARLELAGAVVVTQGFKIRVSGGFDWPGVAVVTVGGVYFFGDR